MACKEKNWRLSMKKERRIISGLLITVLLLLAIGCDTGVSSGGGTYAIGDTGPAGGLIFYIDEADAYSWTYLEVAPASTEWIDKEWGDYGTEIGGNAALTGIGDGQAATDAIVDHMEGESITGTAAQLCDALSYGGYDDWFLPSRDELDAIWDNLVNDGTGANSGVGGFSDYAYWSSSEGTSGLAWFQLFDSGFQGNVTKNFDIRVRAVRAF
jgi:hypothetical protein